MGRVIDGLTAGWSRFYPVAVRIIVGLKRSPAEPRARYVNHCPICGARVETSENGSRIPVGHVCEPGEDRPIETN